MRALAGFLFAVALAAIGYAVSIVPGASGYGEFLAARLLFAASGLLIASAYGVWLYDNRRRVLAGSVLPVALGCLTALAILMGMPTSFMWINSRERAALSTTIGNILTDNSVSMGCMTIGAPPHKLPADGVIYYIEFSAPSQHLGHVETGITGEPGGSLQWPDNFPTFGQRCRISNIGPVTVLDLDIEMPVRFFEAKRMDSSGYSYGKQIDTEMWNPPKNLLVLSPTESFEFYMWNLGPYAVEVTLPARGEGRARGQQDIQEFALKHTSNDPLPLWPVPESKHPPN